MLPEQIRTERLVGMSGGALNLVAGNKGTEGEKGEDAHRGDRSSPGIMQGGMVIVEKRTPAETSDQHAGNGSNLDHADGGTDLPGRDDFLDDTLFGGGKDRALQAQKEKAKDCDTQIVTIERPTNREHDGDLGPKAGHNHLPFGKAVGNPTCQGGKKDEGKDDDSRQNRFDQFGIRRRILLGSWKYLLGDGHAQGHEHELGGIVIDQDLHLHRDKGPKRALHERTAILGTPPRDSKLLIGRGG